MIQGSCLGKVLMWATSTGLLSLLIDPTSLRLAPVSKEKEQLKSRSSILTAQLQQLETFYPAEPEHQKFELKRNPFLVQIMGNLPEEGLENSNLAAKLDGYASEQCPPKIQKRIDAKINDIL